MARRVVELTLTVDKCQMGSGDIYLGWEGWGADCTHGICAPLPLFFCPAYEKV